MLCSCYEEKINTLCKYDAIYQYDKLLKYSCKVCVIVSERYTSSHVAVVLVQYNIHFIFKLQILELCDARNTNTVH